MKRYKDILKKTSYRSAKCCPSDTIPHTRRQQLTQSLVIMYCYVNDVAIHVEGNNLDEVRGRL